ncbi:hypothetical protein DD238_003137 [Peronospora effusa]|uniref:DNA/RNA-binding domain-containing protein n=1 Tax=Peronospora effusa TaxID=542832 RepID=A0A3M6VGA0_9STRA|nr:hypothetical protein DD238_003137 [Peronospora effusa]RQM15517.1 hypothetical protein DD237_002597 [Peronospora effusa]
MVALDKQLRDLLRANPLNVQDANVLRRQLMDAVIQMIDTHIEFAVSKEVELALWKPCFYRRIEDFRRRIRKYAATAQTDRNVREHFARVSSEFQQFLTEASAFYTYLSNVFATWLQQNQPKAAIAESSDVATNVARCRQSLHRCYVFLGDLARYRELHSQKVKKNFAAAEALYHRALAVLPENGNPHNQLAVLATYVEAETVAVYHYCRSLLTSQPFTTAEENLALLFERTRQRPLAAPITLKTSSPLSREKSALLKSYLHRLTRMHGILFALSSPHGSLTAMPGRASSNDLTAPMYPRDMEAVLFKDMQILLHAGVVGDALLLKIVVTNIFCLIRASDSRSQSAPIEDALRLSIRTITCVMEFLLNSLNNKPKTEASGKTLAFSTLRLSGPVAIFCDYLKLHPNMLEQLEQLLVHRPKKLFSEVTTNDQGAGADQFAFVFLETLAKLVNHARIRELYAPLVSNAGQHNDDGLPLAVCTQQHLLKENLELRGFAPLEEDNTASTWQDEWAVQPSATGENSASQVTPLPDDEAANIRAWRLYHFARYLCDGYEGNPLLFYSASGQFTTSPLAEKGVFQQHSGTVDGLASLNLGFLSTDNIIQQQTQAKEAFRNEYQAGSGVDDEDDNFDDEVIVFRPSPALRGMSGNEPTKQHSGYATTVPSSLDTLSGGGTFSLRAPSPISPSDGQGASVSSQSNAFGSGHGSFGSSLGYPSFDTFNGVGSLVSEPLMFGWGNSANSNNTNGNRNDNDKILGKSLGLGLGLPFRGLDTGFMTSSITSGGTSEAQSHGCSSHVGDNRPFAPMTDLAAVERESALYQQRTSSLSAFLSASTPASQAETHSPSSPRMPARPPPGFAAASMGGQQEQQQLASKLLFNP